MLIESVRDNNITLFEIELRMSAVVCLSYSVTSSVGHDVVIVMFSVLLLVSLSDISRSQ